MDKASEAILALKPVTFRYKQEIDPGRSPQFGLVAEDVEKVNPDLVVRDGEGKVNTVRYEAVNAMLLNEFLKEHRKNEEQGATITQQRKDFEAAIAQQHREIEALTATVKEQAAQIQKVSAQLEANKPAAQVVNNNHKPADTLRAKPVGVGAVSQRLIPAGERSGLQTHTATTESVSLCVRMRY